MVASITKSVIDADIGRAIVRDVLDSSLDLVGFDELVGGGFNAAYALRLSDGRRLVMKVAPPPEVAVLRYERDLMAVEAAAMRLAAEWGVPVPAVRAFDQSHRHVGSDVLLIEWCDGVLMRDLRPSMSADDQRHVDEQVAGWLRRLHDHTTSHFGLFADWAPRFDRWSEAFSWMYDQVLADAADLRISLPRPLDELAAIPRRFVGDLDRVAHPTFVVWDMWDHNVFVDPQSLQVVGLIDLERTLWADPLMEINFALKGDDPAYHAGYGGPIYLDDSSRLRRRLYDLYLSTIMVVESTFRRYEDPVNETMGRAWLDGTLSALS